MEKNIVFVKNHEMDKEKFAQLLIMAKGGRTLRHFADLCGTTSSTFTRIIQKANKGASSPALLQAIANNAVPESNVTLEELADANGYVLRQDRVDKGNAYLYNMEQLACNIIFQELVERGNLVQLCPRYKMYKMGKSRELK
jgi:hypothetical protein